MAVVLSGRLLCHGNTRPQDVFIPPGPAFCTPPSSGSAWRHAVLLEKVPSQRLLVISAGCLVLFSTPDGRIEQPYEEYQDMIVWMYEFAFKERVCVCVCRVFVCAVV